MIPGSYPHGSSDEEILQTMQALAEDLGRGGFDVRAFRLVKT
jgi:hypothetical protein